MAYVITEECVGNKDPSCVDVYPVACIHPEPEEPDPVGVHVLDRAKMELPFTGVMFGDVGEPQHVR